jgi:hypothetical protein
MTPDEHRDLTLALEDLTARAEVLPHRIVALKRQLRAGPPPDEAASRVIAGAEALLARLDILQLSDGLYAAVAEREALREALWAWEATQAEQSGYLGPEATQRALEDLERQRGRDEGAGGVRGVGVP